MDIRKNKPKEKIKYYIVSFVMGFWVLISLLLQRVAIRDLLPQSLEIFGIIRICVYGVLCLLLLKRFYNKNDFLMMIIVVIGLFLAIYNSENAMLLSLFLFTRVAGYSHPLKISKVFFWVNLILVFTTVGLSLLGFLPDYQMYSLSGIRHTYGFIHPNSLGLVLFSVIASYFYLKKRKIKIVEYVICLLLVYWLNLETHSRTAVFLLVFLILVIWISENIDVFNDVKIWSVFCNCLLIALICLSLYFMFFFNNGNVLMVKLDNFLSLRLSNASQAYQNVGLTLFGTKDELGKVVDNSYIYLLLSNGVMVFGAYIAYLFFSIRVLYKNNDKKGIIILLTYIFYGFSESILFNPEMNFIVFVVGYYMMQQHQKSNLKTQKRSDAL